MVALSSDMLTGWRCETKLARIRAGAGAGIKTECLWLNQQCQIALERGAIDMGHISRGAYITHHIRQQGTEAKISAAIAQRMIKPLTKTDAKHAIVVTLR